jgi:hypothetical protein
MFKKKIVASVIASILSSAALAQNVILVNEYVKAGVNQTTGTLGSGGNTSPGLLYDSTGTGTFNTSYDYLTPGSPFEGWAVRIVNGGVGTNYHNNNAYVTQVAGGAWVGTPTSSSAVWAVNHSDFNLQHTYSLGAGKQYLDIATQIQANIAMDGLYFARFIDPDARAAAGDSSSTDNVRGYGVIPRANVVFSEALASRYALGLYTTQATGTNTSISPMWSNNPQDYYDNTSGHDVVRGDYTIGVAFYSSGLAVGDIVTYRYAYIFGPSAFASASTAIAGGAGGGTAGTSSFGTLTDVGSATTAASTPSAPTVTGTSVTNEVIVTDAVNTSLPVLTSSLAHHVASKTAGVQTIARETTTTVTNPWVRTTNTTPITTTSYSDSTTTTSRGTTTTTTELYNVVDTSVANDSFSGRADQLEQFANIKSGVIRRLNRLNANNGVSDEKGRIAINGTGLTYSGNSGYSATSSIVGLAYETDVSKNLVVGIQYNKIGSKMSGVDNSGTIKGDHFGVYTNYTIEDFIVRGDVGLASFNNKYNRTIGPFSNSLDLDTKSTWANVRAYTPNVYGFRPFVGGMINKTTNPTKTEAGSVQSAMTIDSVNTTKTTGEYGVSYGTKVFDGDLNLEVGETTDKIKEANLTLSKTDGNTTYAVLLGKNWINDTTSNIIGLNLRIKF